MPSHGVADRKSKANVSGGRKSRGDKLLDDVRRRECCDLICKRVSHLRCERAFVFEFVAG
jgi:hypothetical protein